LDQEGGRRDNGIVVFRYGLKKHFAFMIFDPASPSVDKGLVKLLCLDLGDEAGDNVC